MADKTARSRLTTYRLSLLLLEYLVTSPLEESSTCVPKGELQDLFQDQLHLLDVYLTTPSPFIPLPLIKGKGEWLYKRGFASL